MASTTGWAEPAGSSTRVALERSAGVTDDLDMARLYELHSVPLQRFLVKLTYGNCAEAEDHLQETFLRAWRWSRNNPVDVNTIRPWLFTVARRIAIDAARARKVRPAEVYVECLTGTSDDVEVERFIQAQAIRGALLSLRDEHRSALIQLYYHQRTAREAADVLGIPEGTVKSRAHYGLRALRRAALAADHELGRPRQPVHPSAA